MARVSYGRLTEDDLQGLVQIGALSVLDDPDQVNRISTKGW